MIDMMIVYEYLNQKEITWYAIQFHLDFNWPVLVVLSGKRSTFTTLCVRMESRYVRWRVTNDSLFEPLAFCQNVTTQTCNKNLQRCYTYFENHFNDLDVPYLMGHCTHSFEILSIFVGNSNKLFGRNYFYVVFTLL